MKKIYYIFIFLIIFSLPALATLTAAGTSTAPSYVNTNQTFVMINLTLTGSVNVTGINVTFGGTAGIGNVSQVLIYNDTNSNAAYDTGEPLLGSSTFSGNNAYVSLNLIASSVSKLLIAYKIHNSATRYVSVNASIAANSSITANETVSSFSINSSSSQIQDLHASAKVSPSYVDTNVVNQSFIYNITITGSDYVNKTIITLPSGYVIVNVTNVTIDGTSQTQNCPTPSVTEVCVQGGIGGSTQFNVTYSSSGLSAGKAVRIYFTANTSANPVDSSRFNSTIDGGNLTGIETDVVNSTTNVTTKQLIAVSNVRAIKSTALANGTDYWEFNFTLNITANVSGLVQFKMNNWNNSAGQIMNLTNQTSLINATFYASLRHSSTSTNIFNVTSGYGSSGVSLTARDNNLYYVVLRMVIPSGTPISSSWWTTYWTLFKSTPS